jgi:hypothetical protein
MFLDRLAAAKSNIPEHQDGRTIYQKFVKPAMVDRKKVAAHYGLISLFEPTPNEAKVYCYTVRLDDSQRLEAGRSKLGAGRVKITSEITQDSEILSFGAVHVGDHQMNCGVRVYESDEDYEALKKELADSFNRGDFPEVIRTLDRHFGESTYSLRSIFHDDQRKILDRILKSTILEAEGVYRRAYETNAPMMRFVSDLWIPIPRAFSIAAEFAINSSLRTAFEDIENFDFGRIQNLLQEARMQHLSLDGATLGFALRKTIKKLSEAFVENRDLETMQKLEAATGLARELPFEVNVWRAQNNYYQMLHQVYPERLEAATAGDGEAREWVDHFLMLGRNLAVNVETPVIPELEMAS